MFFVRWRSYRCDYVINCDKAMGKVYNIGSNEEISIEALADKIIKMTASKSKKEYVSYEQAYGRPIEDMMRRKPSIDRIKEAIGWESKTSLHEILEEIIKSEKTKKGTL